MKRTISLLTVLAFLLISSGNLFAQSQNVEATATVEQAITLTLDASPEDVIDFGTIAQGSSPTLDPNGTNSDVGSDATGIAELDISAGNGTTLNISWNTDAALGDGSGNTMAFSADVDGSQTNDSPGGSTDVTNGGSVTADGSGNFYLYVGGSLTVGASQTTGSYTTTNGTAFTITVNY